VTNLLFYQEFEHVAPFSPSTHHWTQLKNLVHMNVKYFVQFNVE